MTQTGYSERELVSNRASVLLYGGTDKDRRAWAEQAQQQFAHEGELVEITSAQQLAAALNRANGVVYIPDVGALSTEAQAAVLRCLQEREERPKIVVGVAVAVEEARFNGSLREDLLYRLDRARVDLSVAENREALKKRSALLAARPKEPKSAPSKQAAPRTASRHAPVKAAAKKPAPKKAGKR